MILVAAALREELEIALALCGPLSRIRGASPAAWEGSRRNSPILLAKLGMGPARAARSAGRVIGRHRPSRLLLFGYAGALSRELQVGDIVVVEWAVPAHRAAASAGSVEELAQVPPHPLAESGLLLDAARSAGPRAVAGGALTLPGILGKPAHKAQLRDRFGADVVDMETGALAELCAAAGVPMHCVRAVSDAAEDDFLAPVSWDPATRSAARVREIIAAGHWLRRRSAWRDRAETARRSLKATLPALLDALQEQDP